MQVQIRPLEEKDAKISYQWRNNPIIWKYTGSKPNKVITLEIETEWIQKVLQRKNEKRYAILTDNQYIGNIQLTNINKGIAEFHIFIGNPDFWGKGIATKAMDELIDIAKKELKLLKIYLEVHPQNTSAIHLYGKKGFVNKGIKNNMLYMEKLL